MKNNVFLAACAAIFITSCDCKFDMTTVVDRDGSITRVITCPADSAFLCGDREMSMDPLNSDVSPIIITDDWQLSWSDSGRVEQHPWPVPPQQYGSLSGKHVVHMTRRFDSSARMSAEFQFDLMPIKPHSEFSRKFKWFYTDYSFSETFPQPEFKIPVTDYLDIEMAGLWFAGGPQFEGIPGSQLFSLMSEYALAAANWLYANYLLEYYLFIADTYDDLDNPPLSKQEFLAQKQAFIDNHVNVSEEPDFENGLRNALTDQFGSDYYYNAIVSQDIPSASWFLFQDFSFDYTVVMPGKPLPVYGAITDGHAQTRHLTLGMIYPEDYTVTVQSRAVNWWAWILSALTVLLAIGSFVFPKRR